MEFSPTTTDGMSYVRSIPGAQFSFHMSVYFFVKSGVSAATKKPYLTITFSPTIVPEDKSTSTPK